MKMIKILIVYLCIFFGLGRLYDGAHAVKVMPAKTALKAIQKAPKFLSNLKNIKKIPSLSRNHEKILKNILKIRDGVKPDAWNKIEQSIDFFKKVQKLLNYANITSTSIPIGWRDDEILICEPNTPGDTCHSPCEQGSSNYRWCYRKPNSSFDYCSCRVRTSIKHWILLMKKLMDANMIVDKETKKIEDRKSDTDQWIVIVIFGTLLTSLIFGIVIRIGYNYQKNRKAEVNNPGSENSELQDIS